MTKAKKTEVVVLHSGGIDSTATIHFYTKMGNNVVSLFVDYGQMAAKYERKAVRRICKHYKIKCEEIKIESSRNFKDGLITGRNLFLLSAALLYKKMDSGVIAIGIHSGTDYIDCGQAFLANVNRIYTQYSNGKIIVGAPFLNMSKMDIFQYCRLEGVPLQQTYSCEKGVFPSCGRCQTCKETKLLYDSQDK